MRRTISLTRLSLSQKGSFLLHAGDVLNFRSGATPKLNVKSAGALWLCLDAASSGTTAMVRVKIGI
jgi:hypothetical protein